MADDLVSSGDYEGPDRRREFPVLRRIIDALGRQMDGFERMLDDAQARLGRIEGLIEDVGGEQRMRQQYAQELAAEHLEELRRTKRAAITNRALAVCTVLIAAAAVLVPLLR